MHMNGLDRRRNVVVQIALTLAVVIFAVAVVTFIVVGKDKKAAESTQIATGSTQFVRITSDSVIKKDGSAEPKAVLSIYEDFQCPFCKHVETNFGPTIDRMVKSGAIAVDYYMVAILNRFSTTKYSTRAANSGYCVADESKEAFQRYYSALFANQPKEGSGMSPDNGRLIELARQAGAGGNVADCINSGKYDQMVDGLASAMNIDATPTLRLNGEDIEVTNPDELIAKVEAIVGEVPGMRLASDR